MNKPMICWKGKAFKQLSFGKTKSAGRNSAGCITLFHRGGGSKRLQRRIDFQRNTLSTGVVERIEYDPNRSSRIALIRWSSLSDDGAGLFEPRLKKVVQLLPDRQLRPLDPRHQFLSDPTSPLRGVRGEHSSENLNIGATPTTVERQDLKQKASALCKKKEAPYFSYILACDQLKSGDEVMNLHLDSSGCPLTGLAKPPQTPNTQNTQNTQNNGHEVEFCPLNLPSPVTMPHKIPEKGVVNNFILKLGVSKYQNQKIGTNSTLAQATLGSLIHNIESYPGQGGKLVRAAGTFAQLVQKFEKTRICIVRLPSGRQYLLDLQCRATIGVVSNTSHSTRKLTKAGQSRWLGKRPVVRGVAMNPIDHPHGGGAGRTKGGRPSVSPWGKPTKGAKSRPTRKPPGFQGKPTADE